MQMLRQSAIVGENVTKFARSPSIWNELYKVHDIKGRMDAFDCSSADLPNTVANLIEDTNFHCALIAAPLKSENFWFQYGGSKIVNASNATNFFSVSNNLEITLSNFDGLAAIMSLINKFADFKFRNILLIGTGPVARSIYFELSSLNPKTPKNFSFLTRDTHKISPHLKKVLRVVTFIDYSQILSSSFEFDLIINCTPLGSPRSNESPLPLAYFRNLPPKTVYFDVNYGSEDPAGCKIATEAGLLAVTGKEMNSIQAALAFKHANLLDTPIETLVSQIEGL